MEQTTGSPYNGYNIHTYPSAWYLTKITNASGTESITLNYVDEGVMLQFGPRMQTYEELRSEWSLGGSFRKEGRRPPPPPYDVFPTKVALKRLVSIVSDKYSVYFGASESRQDVRMESGLSSALSDISVVGHDGQIIKIVDFDYGYFDNRCLKLNAITDRGLGGGSAKHQFEYNESGGFGAGNLSPVDKYNYLNGWMAQNMYISKEVYQYGSNRTPNFPLTQLGSIKKIIYPTGGTTTFLYEANRNYDGDKYLIYDSVAATTVYRQNSSTTNQLTSDVQFQIHQDQTVSITFSRVDKIPYNPGTSPVEVDHDNVAEVEIRRVFDIIGENGIEGQTVGAAVYQGKIVLNANNTGQTETFAITAGKYVVRAICDKDELEVAAIVKYKYHTSLPDPGAIGAGIRLKSLEHNNGFGNILRKNYTYTNDSGFSSGIVLGNNGYSSRDLKRQFHSLELFGAVVVEHNFLKHASFVAETQGIGLPHYYQKVREESVSISDTLRTEYYFDYFPGTRDVELTRKVDYRNSGNEFSPHRKTEIFFSDEVYGEAFAGMDIYISTEHVRYDSGTLLIGEPYLVDYAADYNIDLISWKFRKSERETVFEQDQVLIAAVRYFHDPATRNLIGVRHTSSDGTSVYTKYKYPEDYTSAIGSTLLAANKVSPIIEEQVWRKRASGDSVMVSGRINHYVGLRLRYVYVLESANGLTSLSNETKTGGKYNTIISDPLYQKKVEFNYDASGRVLSQQLTNNLKTSYIWGYPAVANSGSTVQGKIFPVAEVKNAEPNAVFHTSFEDHLTGTTMPTVTGFKAFSGSYIIPASFTGQYKLTYWKKSGTNPWQLQEAVLTNPSNHVIDATGSFIDEIRLYPADAQLTTYTYRSGLGIATINDANNNVMTFEYDAMGRLKLVRDHAGQITNSIKYHVKDEVINVE